MTYVLAIDQGTTSSRAIIFDKNITPIVSSHKEFKQYFPASGWVEHDPADIWSTVVATCREAIAKAKIDASQITAIGIANQRETTLVWDKNTGLPISNAIVWQDRRTADYCESLKAQGHEKLITDVTGLLIDPYFCATKLHWLLTHIDGAMQKAQQGDLLFGTVDSYLIWKFTKGKVHCTDATNAARTMLYDIHQGEWSSQLCALLAIPEQMLPKVNNCADDFGVTSSDILGSQIPIFAVLGDQHAATIGHACFQPGMMKSTYGTGCFVLLNTGSQAVKSRHRLLTTIAYQFDGKTTYALEGSIFVAGASVQWLRDGLKIINIASQAQDLALSSDDKQELVFVPAFTGLGSPYWKPECRGAIFGITRGSRREEFARAALESIGFQTRDLLEAMQMDWSSSADGRLRVDGGMCLSGYTMQFLSDITNLIVDRPAMLDATALGVAWVAGMHAGVYPSQEEFMNNRSIEASFIPNMPEAIRLQKYSAWKRAIKATIVATNDCDDIMSGSTR